MTKTVGRPSYEPTPKEREQVKTLAGLGIQHTDIAKVIGISAPTLRKHFAQELEVGHIQANAQVAQSLFRAATAKDKPSVVAAIFWLKCQAGWREQDPPGDEPPTRPALGKKEQAQEDAKDADVGTGWDGLLPKQGTTLQ